MTEELLKENVFRPAREDGVWKVRAMEEEQSLPARPSPGPEASGSFTARWLCSVLSEQPRLWQRAGEPSFQTEQGAVWDHDERDCQGKPPRISHSLWFCYLNWKR